MEVLEAREAAESPQHKRLLQKMIDEYDFYLKQCRKAEECNTLARI